MAAILLTGANGNLGQSVVERFLRDKHKVIAVTGQAGLADLPVDPGLETMTADLMDEVAAADLVNKVIRSNADLSAAVLLVGGFAMGKIAETGKKDLEKMISLNFFTAYNIVRPLLPYFLEKPGGGQFILIGSRPGLDAAAGKDFFAYSLSKAMVFKLAEFINAEGKNREVTATVIVPSTIDTVTNREAMPGEDFSKWVPPSAIADAVAFILSPPGRMMRDGVMKIYNRS